MSQKTDIWMPFYIGDYLADTIGLTYSEHGIYILLIFSYWRKGSALEEHEAKAVMRHASVTESKRIENYFRIAGGKWHHSRIDKELEAASRNKDNRKRSAIIASNARWGKKCVTDASRMRIECPSPSPYPSLKEVLTECTMRGIPPEHGTNFWNHFESVGWVNKHNQPIKDWRPKLHGWSVSERNNQGERNHKPNGSKRKQTDEEMLREAQG